MDLYFDQQGQISTKAASWRAETAAAAIARGDDGTEAPLIVPFREGWAIASYQPQHLTPERRAAAVMRGDDGNEGIYRQNLTPDIWEPGWFVQPFQPPAPGPRWARIAAALSQGDEGIPELIFIAPWTQATPRSSFPNIQSDVRAAIPSYNAGPQVGAIKSQPNINEPMLLKGAPGTLFAITVVAAGTTAGGFYDAASVAAAGAANQVSPIPTTGGPLFLFEWPCQQGIVIIPGAGQVLAAKWT